MGRFFPTHVVARISALFAVTVCMAATLSCSDAPAPDADACPPDQVVVDDGTCVAPACKPGNCDRGVCAPAEGCVNADACDGDDACLAGYFCTADGACRRDLCIVNGRDCARGVCDRAAGECVDVAPCEDSLDCVAGKRCLEGTCTAEGILCGEGGCPGDQICDFNEATLSAECIEVSPCQTARDCFEGRVCAGSRCMSAPVCVPDTFEPNESRDDPADFDLVSHNRALDAVICGGDTDTYALAVAPPMNTSQRFALRLVVDTPERERGLGRLAATLETPAGDTLPLVASDDSRDLELEHPLPLGTRGRYLVTVESANPQAAAGMHYRLSARVQPRELSQQCESAEPMQLETTVEGDTSVSTTTLQSRCLSDKGPADIYTFELTETRTVSARLEASGAGRFAVGLRTACNRSDSELTCANGGASALAQLDETPLAPGLYWLVVQSPSPQDAGAYSLSVWSEPAACSPADSSCTSMTSARVCDPTAERFVTHRCELGCQPHTGRCRPAPGASCAQATLVTGSQTFDIAWDEHANDYEMPLGHCQPQATGSSQSDGPDTIYRVAVPDGHAVTATLRPDDTSEASLYILEDCMGLENRCIDGANEDAEDTETLTYANTSDQPRSLFVVADSADDVTGTAELTIDVAPIVCRRWDSRCSGNELQRCDATRTGWRTLETCQWGCTGSACDPPPGDLCLQAEHLTSGQSYSGSFAEYADHHESVLSSCSADFPGDQTPQIGPDAYFTVDLAKGDLLTARLTTDARASLFVFENCQAGPAASCLRSRSDAESLDFYAPQTGIYYVGVDAADEGATEDFELAVDIQSGAAVCQPGGAHCDPATGELVVCDAQGTSESARYQCPQSCSPHGCFAGTTLNDACSTAYRIDGSTRLVDDLTRFSDDFVAPPTCGPSDTDGPDAVYQIDLAADEVLKVTAHRGFRPILYLVTDCTDTLGTCEESSEGRYAPRPSVEYATTAPETVYLVVDSKYAPFDGQYQLDVTIDSAQCAHGDAFCSSQTELSVCGDNRLWSTHACQGSCAGGRCGAPTGEICQDAITVADGQTVDGNWSGMSDLEIRPPQTGQCRYGARGGLAGADTFYRIDLQQGDLLKVDLRTHLDAASVVFLRDCAAAESCLPGSRAADATGAYYFAESAGPVWVMADSNRPFVQADYQLSFDVTESASCAPNQSSCVDSSTVAQCNSDGTAIRATYDCPSGCARGACQADVYSVDSCTTAPNIGEGIVAYVDAFQLTNSVDATGDPDYPCSPQPEPDRDVVYEVTVNPGEVLHAASPAATFSLVENCFGPNNWCAGNGDPGFYSPGDHDELFWAPSQTRTVKVVADITFPHENDTAKLLVEKLPAECTPGARRCSPGGDQVQVCGNYRRWKSRPCQLGCSNGRCGAPSGEYCEDAFQVSAGQSIAGSFDEAVDDVRAVSGEHCNGGVGADHVYEVELDAGDLLQAKLLTENKDGLIYVLENCAEPTTTSCVRQTSVEPELEYLAPSTGSYYVVVDVDDRSTRGDYVLELDRLSGRVCQPNATECDASTGRARRCNEDGAGYGPAYQCANGCGDKACAPPSTPNDTCSTAYPINGSTVIEDTFGRFKNDDYRTICGVASSTSYVEADSVYEVSLDANEVLKAKVTTRILGTDEMTPHLYVVSGCSTASSACMAASDPEVEQAEVTYHASSAETVYLIVDAIKRTKQTYQLEVETLAPECTPGTSTCVNSATLEHCPAGLTERRECASGCANGACNSPANDTCAGATSLVRDSTFHTYTANLWRDYSNGKDIDGTANGPDALYRIDAARNDVLTAIWSGSSNIKAWVTDNCRNAASNVVAIGQYGPLSHTFQAAGTYWLVLDSVTTEPIPPVTLDARIAPKICQPGESVCTSTAGQVRHCNADGTAYKDYRCSGGCTQEATGASCGQPRGEYCFDAIDATGGASFAIDVKRMDNTFAGGTRPCDLSSHGDAIFRVDLIAGQTVDAHVVPDPDGSPGVYILNACPAQRSVPQQACLDGSGAIWGNDVSASYTATTDETVYVVVSAGGWSSNAMPWHIDIDVR